jgi:ATP-binding protein involved in chromosome partitioning
VSDPFGKGGFEAMAEKVEIPFLGRIPLALPIREAGDSGEPPAASDSAEGEAFAAIARKVADWLARESA